MTSDGFYDNIPPLDPNRLVLYCDCHDQDHQVQFRWYKDPEHEDLDELSIMPLLNENPYFWQRLINAFCYLFRIKRTKFYYHFDSVSLDMTKKNQLIEWLQSLK